MLSHFKIIFAVFFLAGCAGKKVTVPVQVLVPNKIECKIIAPLPAGERPELIKVDPKDQIDSAAAITVGNLSVLMAYLLRVESERDGWKFQALSCNF
jgi:hypothetical protein